ncbi:MAG: dihydroorotate dehydrogenase (quinone), partial [Coleofasciculaceae cyanobacterium]
MDIYQLGLRPLLFSVLKADPEWLHQRTLGFLGWLDANRDSSSMLRLRAQLRHSYCLHDPAFEQTLWGLKFPNFLGLAAGFDKDGVAANLWSDFGFGFAELGTVTMLSQAGNPRPRLFR